MRKTILIVVSLLMLSLIFTSVSTAGSAMDRILKKGELLIGTTGKQPPMIATTKKGDIIGLIQLNDRQRGMFNEDLIVYFEMIGNQIGLAVNNSWIHTKLQKAMEEIKTLRGIIPICSN